MADEIGETVVTNEQEAEMLGLTEKEEKLEIPDWKPAFIAKLRAQAHLAVDEIFNQVRFGEDDVAINPVDFNTETEFTPLDIKPEMIHVARSKTFSLSVQLTEQHVREQIERRTRR